MPDREKVIKGLECRLECGCMQEDHCNSDCPYLGDPRACSGLDEDVIALLKAQEPVKPLKMEVEHVRKEPVVFSYQCPVCMCGLQRHWVACPICGTGVKWE